MKMLVAVLSLAIFLSNPGAVLALDIIVNHTGQITFSDNQVLGKNTESGKNTTTGSQTVIPNSGKKIEITPQARNLEVKVINKNADSKNILKEDSKTETNRLKMEIPLDQTAGETDGAEGETNTYLKKYQEKLLAERELRAKEKLEIRNSYSSDGEASLELESGRVIAKLNGAQFTYDPDTDTVTLTTPSGNIHTLKHMPDQAIARMRVVTNTPILVEPSDPLEIETGEDSDVVYTTTIQKNKKFLGLINRTVETEVSLDDETGEVTETEEPEGTIIDTVLNALSF